MVELSFDSECGPEMKTAGIFHVGDYFSVAVGMPADIAKVANITTEEQERVRLQGITRSPSEERKDQPNIEEYKIVSKVKNDLIRMIIPAAVISKEAFRVTQSEHKFKIRCPSRDHHFTQPSHEILDAKAVRNQGNTSRRLSNAVHTVQTLTPLNNPPAAAIHSNEFSASTTSAVTWKSDISVELRDDVKSLVKRNYSTLRSRRGKCAPASKETQRGQDIKRCNPNFVASLAHALKSKAIGAWKPGRARGVAAESASSPQAGGAWAPWRAVYDFDEGYRYDADDSDDSDDSDDADLLLQSESGPGRLRGCMMCLAAGQSRDTFLSRAVRALSESFRWPGGTSRSAG
jgi:hypothetical protein